jgi:PWWP domain
MELDLYTGGDVVWVKMGNCWWPGEVCRESQMPQGLLASMKGRPPIAVVRFFQEKTL